jgi:hypothetical protein
MSYNFGEIIKKLYSLFQEAKPSRHSRLPPHLLASCDGGFSTWWREMCQLQAPFSLARFAREMEGEGGVICESMPFDNGSSDRAQIQHENGQ